jgi:hypothetical protein
MARYDAYGTTLGQGTRQVETALVVGTVTNAGNIHVVCTSASIAGSPLQTVVAVLLNDTADTVATKIITALNLVAAITLNFVVGGTGPNVTLTRKLAAADEAALNIDYHQDGGTAGLTDDLSSTTTTAGEAYVTIAQVASFGGPGMSLDTEDVTTHDQATAFEEVVATILRSGEMTMDIVYDPVDDTHDKAGSLGMLYRMDSKKLSSYKCTFPDAGSTIWYFDAYCTGFEPGAAHDGALTASTTLKLTGVPTLA